MKEHGFQKSGMVSDAQRKRLGEMSGADYICVSTLTKSNTEFYLEAYLIEVETGEISNPASKYGILEGGTYANLFQICQNLAQELIGSVDSHSESHLYHPNANVASQHDKDYTETAFNINMKMIYVEGGTFNMGCTREQSDCRDDEKNVRSVTLDGYYIGMLEVTQAQWEKVMGLNMDDWYNQLNKRHMYIIDGDKEDFEWLVDGDLKDGDTIWPDAGWGKPDCHEKTKVGPDYPMYLVNWEDARLFCEKLSKKTGKNYQLPTEAQWEYAARGGNKANGKRYSGSNSIEEVAWYRENGKGEVHYCGALRPNALGIFDMTGNVKEWCWDVYIDTYLNFDTNNPKGPQPQWSNDLVVEEHVARGGAYDEEAKDCSVCRRDAQSGFLELSDLGVRVVCIP